MSKSIITVFIFLNIFKLCTAQMYAFSESEIKNLLVHQDCYVETGEKIPVVRKYESLSISMVQSKTYRLAFLNELLKDKITIMFKNGSELVFELCP